MNNESGELIFLRYAYPVIDYCSQIKVNAEERLDFERMLRKGESPDRKRLEILFPEATGNLNSWDLEEVKRYWLIEHNKCKKNNPICQIYLLEVSGILPSKGNEICRIKTEQIKIMNPVSYIPLKKGDRVSIHALKVAEKLSQEEIDKYFRK